MILQVLFSNLEKLELYRLHELKEIWHHQLPHNSFSNLRILIVVDCGSLLNIIPCHLIQSFKNLKEIYMSECRNLKHVFDLQGCDTYGEILPKLEFLHLYDLKKLKGIIICNNEENDDARGLFSPSMPISFQNLQCLSIDDCGEEVEEDEVLFGEKVSFLQFFFLIFSYYFWKILTKTFHKNMKYYLNVIFVNKNKNTKLILILILHDTMVNKGILKRKNLIKQNFKFKNNK